MAPLKFSKLVSYSSEDPRFPASNLLGEGKWMCKDEGKKQVWVLLQLVETSVITNIDIGNAGAAFIEVQVGMLGADPDQMKVLLVAGVGDNTGRVRMFGVDKLSKEVAKEKWDLVKVVLTLDPTIHLSNRVWPELHISHGYYSFQSNATSSVAASLRDKGTFRTPNPFTVLTSVQFTGLSSPSFELLPPEVLENILGYLGFPDLNSVALVCRSWSSMAQSPRLWKEIKIEVKAQNIVKVTSIPRLALVKHMVLSTNDVIKTKITINHNADLKMHVK